MTRKTLTKEQKEKALGQAEENVRANFALSGVRVSDSQWQKIKKAAELLKGKI